MKIGIFGGTFNPVHKGHEKMIRHFVNELCLDKVIIVPTKIPPHKSDYDVIDANFRIEMLKLCFKEDIYEISEIETADKKRKKSYTVDTLKKLKKIYPLDELYLCLGSDMFLSFDRWRKPKEISKLCTVVGASRNSEDSIKILLQKAEELKQLGTKSVVVPFEYIDVSSSRIRDMIKAGNDPSEYIKSEVWEYIKFKGLYGIDSGLLANYKSVLLNVMGEKRLLHCLGTAEEAKRLAVKNNVSVYKAYMCGLLHDITKNLDKDEQYELCKKYSLINDENMHEITERKLTHALTGAYYIKNELKIEDEDIFNAVRYHTTARENMSCLEKIIYIADAVEKNRKYDGVEGLRKTLKKQGLDKACLECLYLMTEEQKEKNKKQHVNTVKACEWFEDIIKKEKIYE